MSGKADERVADAVSLAEHERWPDVYTVPRAALRAAIAAWVVRWIARDLPVRITSPGVRNRGRASARVPELSVRRPSDFYRRIGTRGLIGFGESYQAGDWDSDDLVGLIEVFAARADSMVPRALRPLRRLASARRPRGERNSPVGARRNISRHYDLSDELFALFLDQTMTYSSALFEQDSAGRPAAGDRALAAAQRRKIDRLLDSTGTGPGTRLLEIGSGWGELAVRAAERGATVRTITLSANQYEYTLRKVAEAGVQDRVSVSLCDYREAQGEYDVILSVEMIEAVGREYWPDYFGALAGLLAPGGRIGLQAITMPHRRMVATAGSQTWITKYIFPGGLLPSMEAIAHQAEQSGLRIVDDFAFGPHYARTLRLWRQRFISRAERLRELGFDQTFQRTWNLYLAYCEAGFAADYLDVHQIVLTHA